jgi:hypothetical protein
VKFKTTFSALQALQSKKWEIGKSAASQGNQQLLITKPTFQPEGLKMRRKRKSKEKKQKRKKQSKERLKKEKGREWK